MRPGLLVLAIIGGFLFLFLDSYIVQWIGITAVLVVGVSYAYSEILSRGLVVTRADERLRAYKHEYVDVRLTIENDSFLPVPYLLINDNPGSLYSGHENHALLSMRAHEQRILEYSIKTMNRGFYRIGPVSVRFTDPLGLFPRSQTLFAETQLVVYPRVYPLSLDFHHGLPAGVISAQSRIYEDPTRYRSIREYVPGDEIRRVNWKATARLGALHSTEWLPTINVPVLLLINLTAGDFLTRNRFHHVERTIDAAASLTQHLAHRGQEIGLISSGTLRGHTEDVMPAVRVAAGMEHAISILETLAELDVNRDEIDITRLLLERGTLAPGTRLFYMGPALAEDRLAGLLAAVKNRSLLRLHYIQEGAVREEATAPGVSSYQITEYGDELFTRKS